MAGVYIHQLPAAAPLDGTEFLPCEQGGDAKHCTTQDVANLVPVLVGPPGPSGPAGPAGPPGPVYAAPFTFVNPGMSPYTVQPTDTVLIVDTTGFPVVINLPLANTWAAGPLTIKRADTNAAGTISVFLSGADHIDIPTGVVTVGFSVGFAYSEAKTFVSDGVSLWYLLGGIASS